MPDASLRIAYLAPDAALLEHDRPVLEAMGHTVLVPQGADENWLDVPDPGIPEHPASAFVALRDRADCVIAGPDPEYLTPLIRGFEGRVIIRVVGGEDWGTVGDWLKDIGGPRLVSACEKARGRVFLASTPNLLTPSREGGSLRIGFVPPPVNSTHSLHLDGIRFVFALKGDSMSFWDENAVRWIAELGKADQPAIQKLVGMAEGSDLPRRTSWFRVGPCMVVRPLSRSTAPGLCLHALARKIPVLHSDRSTLAGWLGRRNPGALREQDDVGRVLTRMFSDDRFAARVGNRMSSRSLRASTDLPDAGWSKTGMSRFHQLQAPKTVRRIAVVMPEVYRGGTIRGFKHVCLMIREGARKEGIEVVAVVRARSYDMDMDFAELAEAGVPVREFEFAPLEGDLAGRFRSETRGYAVLDDGANDLLDCDFLLFISDRVPFNVPPSVRYGMLAFDCLQRYCPNSVGRAFFDIQRQAIMPVLRSAEFVAVTTPSSAEDFRSYFGLDAERVIQVPVFLDVEHLPASPSAGTAGTPPPGSQRAKPYIAWVTNNSPHKNHEVVIKALDIYYGQLGGQLEVRMCGSRTEDFRAESRPTDETRSNVKRAKALLNERPMVRERMRILGELSDSDYARLIADASAVLNPSIYDNGSFSAMDGAYAGVPVVQSRHPANSYFDELFAMNSLFFDSYNPASLAMALRQAELGDSKPSRSSKERIAESDWRRVAPEFWTTLKRAIGDSIGGNS